MRKILLIPLLFMCLFVKAQTPVNVSQPQKFLKRIYVEGSLLIDSIIPAADSTNKGINSAWARRTFVPLSGAGYVPTTRQVLNGYGILGGTSLAADITKSVDTSLIVSKIFSARYPLKSTTIAGFDLRGNITLSSLTNGYGVNSLNYAGSSTASVVIDTASSIVSKPWANTVIPTATLAKINTKQNIISGTGYAKYAGTTQSFVAAIPNADLANSTISGVSLGANLFNLTNGYGLSSFSYNGSAAVAPKVDSVEMVNKTFFNTVIGAATLARIASGAARVQIGSIISKTFANTTGFGSPVGSATFGATGGTLTITGGSTKTLSNYLPYTTYGKTNAENWTMQLSAIVNTATSTSFGVGLGVQGSALAIQGAVLLDNTNRGKLAFYFNNGTSTEDLSPVAITGGIANTDNVTLQLVRVRNTYILNLTNNTTGQTMSFSKTVPYDYGNTSYRPNNSGYFTIYSLGGTVTSTGAFTVNNDCYKTPKILFLGDSQSEGAFQKNPEQRMPTQLGKMSNATIEVNAGGGNYVEEINATEALSYTPDNIFIFLGTNNLLNGESSATVKGKIDVLVASLTGYTAGTNLWILTVPPNNSFDATNVNALLKATYGSAIIDIYSVVKATSGTGINAVASPDGTHVNTEYQLRTAQAILAQGVQKGIFKVNPAYQSYFNPVYQDNLGRIMASASNQIQYAQLDAVSAGTQIRFSPVNTTVGGGGVLFSSGASNASTGAGLFYDGVDNLATATSASRIRFNAGAINFYSNSGLTVGSYLPTSTDRFGFSTTTNNWIFKNGGGVIFGGASTAPADNLNVRDYNSGTDNSSTVVFDSSNQTAGTLSSSITTNGNISFNVSNGTNKIRQGGLGSINISSTLGSESGDVAIYAKAPGLAATIKASAVHDYFGNLQLGTGSLSSGLSPTPTSLTNGLFMLPGTAATADPTDGGIAMAVVSNRFNARVNGANQQVAWLSDFTGNAITTTGNQTGLTGDKTTSGIWGFGKVGINGSTPIGTQAISATGDIAATGAGAFGSTVTSTGLTLTSTPTTSAGTYDFITRNTSTGVVEKVASSTVPAYSEGTWTPTGSLSLTSASGTYTKIGNMVYATFFITVSAGGTGGSFVVSGLPFTSSSVSTLNHGGYIIKQDVQTNSPAILIPVSGTAFSFNNQGTTIIETTVAGHTIQGTLIYSTTN